MEIVETGRLKGFLHSYSKEIPGRTSRPCILIFPGGGYNFLSERENEPVALAYFAAGYNVFTLNYSCGEGAADFRPLIEASEAIVTLRERCEEWHIEPNKIALVGFSAGAHTAASIGTLWNCPALSEKFGEVGEKNRPDAMVLCYSVISSGVFAHRGSFNNISHKGSDKAALELLSLENQVTAGTPPTFLWHTADDMAVPVENTLLMASALRKAGVSFECHIFPEGNHGLSLCNNEVGSPNAHCSKWFKLSLVWLAERFSFEY